MCKLAVFVFFLPFLSFAAKSDIPENIQIFEALKLAISEQYVLEDTIPQILTELSNPSFSDTLKSQSSNIVFAQMIEQKLQQFDKHFSFAWEKQEEVSTHVPTESYWDGLNRKNSGFNKLEILDGNIGYVSFWGFDKVNKASRERVASVMAFLSNTKSIIFDLRDNGGGQPEMVQLISSYLFKERVQLSSLYWRDSGETDEFWTFKRVNGKKRPNIPVYIVTSNKTFSAAEAFAYDLQSLKRAIVIGETTGGGAHPMRFIDFGAGFVAGIPYGKAVNPVTQSNWEWTGVKPDITTSKEKAFDVAYYTALKNALVTPLSPIEEHEIEIKLKELTNH